MRPTPAESLFCGSSASVFDGLRDVSVAEVLDQADADQGHNEQAGEHRDECGVAVGLIRRVGNYERGQLVAGQTGERPGAQRQTVRGGDGFGAEVLIKQHGQARLLEEVYKACKEELTKPREERRNCVKAIYEGLTDAEISREITRLVTPHDAPCPVEVIFQTIENLHESIEGPCGDWYFTGDYPTPGGYTTVNVAYMRWFEGKGGRAYDLPL